MISKLRSVIKDPKLTFYRASFNKVGQSSLMMIRTQGKDFIIVEQDSEIYQQLTGEKIAPQMKKCPTSHQNRLILNQYFAYTKPQALIAKYFDYKISVHSGSDKFSIFPIVA